MLKMESALTRMQRFINERFITNITLNNHSIDPGGKSDFKTGFACPSTPLGRYRRQPTSSCFIQACSYTIL